CTHHHLLELRYIPTRRSSDLHEDHQVYQGVNQVHGERHPDARAAELRTEQGHPADQEQRRDQDIAVCQVCTRGGQPRAARWLRRSEEHTSELQSLAYLVCRLL